MEKGDCRLWLTAEGVVSPKLLACLLMLQMVFKRDGY
jgi:hypothetical protein